MRAWQTTRRRALNALNAMSDDQAAAVAKAEGIEGPNPRAALESGNHSGAILRAAKAASLKGTPRAPKGSRRAPKPAPKAKAAA